MLQSIINKSVTPNEAKLISLLPEEQQERAILILIADEYNASYKLNQDKFASYLSKDIIEASIIDHNLLTGETVVKYSYNYHRWYKTQEDADARLLGYGTRRESKSEEYPIMASFVGESTQRIRFEDAKRWGITIETNE